MSSKRASDDAVIDLTLDSEDEQDMGSTRNPSNKSTPSSKRARTDDVTSASNGFEEDDDDEILVIDKDEFEKKPAAKPSLKSPPKSSENGVELVDSTVACPTAEAAPSNNDDGDAELAIVGTRNEYKLPHSRHDCTTCKFTPNPSNRNDLRAQNDNHCDLCYCYVCDAPVKDCKSWTNTDRAWQKSHCNATNEHDCWKRMRQQVKGGNSSGTTASATAQQRTPPAGGNRDTYLALLRALGPGMGAYRSTFMSDDEDDYERDDYDLDDEADEYYGNFRSIPKNKTYAPGKLPSNLRADEHPACPHCKWHNNSGCMQTNNSQRCFKCGRLAVERRRPEQYTHKYSYKKAHHKLGVRELPFRIVAQDVRQDYKYRISWQEAKKDDPNWKYDEAAMKKSVFDYKIGKRPFLRTVLGMVSEWDEKTARQKNEDSIVMDPNDIALIRAVSQFQISPSRFAYETNDYVGDVTAVWDARSSTGTIKIRLDYVSGKSEYNQMVLGCWSKVFPLKVSHISGTLKAAEPPASRWSLASSTPDDIESLFAKHNDEADKIRSSLALTSSTGNPDVGGFTDADFSFRGMLEKYNRETFIDQHIGRSLDWDKISDHKNGSDPRDLTFVLSYRDRAFAESYLIRSARMTHQNDRSTESVLLNLENLGHTPELTCEGLAVEMLEFQKQSLKWAMERETTPGGIQSYFWAKVPIEGSTLYFNPILQSISSIKPREVRGGIIAEEMGLGKTIISLALILKHPAPELPASGSNVSCLANIPAILGSNTPNWNKGLNDQTSTDNPLRGSILSRGTLVICPVSLVGQWIEEAKSKLSDPGLLYPYHGGNRIRDAGILAKNAIVVTTYQVLASDDTYHRKKSSDPDKFCPPLEQVRWWRVICDEGHQLRQANTNRNRSISGIVADHKWIVTGTPVSTSMFDLINQLKLLGIESVDEMIRNCCDKPSSRNTNQYIRRPGKLLFLLRNVMIRHTQKQCYRGTNTTLMSLPPKKELSIEVSLSKAERKEYDALDKAAKDFYVRFKASHAHELSKHYLLLSQKLTPQRVACSGGNPPLNPEDGGSKNDDYDDEEDVKVQRKSEIKYSAFCFTAKMKVLIAELKKARENDPTSKSLVFSHFNLTLKLLKEELPKHGFEFRTLSGSMSMKQRTKSLHDFQADPPTTIFLLSMRAGNCGINLTQANRVFLMEPGFNPALEKQAIGRVHRLGQKRNVEIIRLFVKDSIETRIRKFLETKYGAASDADSKKEAKNSGNGVTGEIEAEVIAAPVGNLATERPKNKIVTSEFDMLFGVESDNGAIDAAMPDAAMSSGFL
ncbi:unnamed protein product [Cylindrotheca closterium]|uniref:Uncharacterized protein n=1 Tax=Cylindrotheca closterium TaxID=2856 RepID=A0AAD2FQB6_9STRA|nr:unnamed protein product [Cylindrotheca closterium]